MNKEKIATSKKAYSAPMIEFMNVPRVNVIVCSGPGETSTFSVDTSNDVSTASKGRDRDSFGDSVFGDAWE